MLKPFASAGTVGTGATSPARGVRPVRPSAAGVISSSVERSGVFHYLLLFHVFLFCTRVHEFIPQIRIAGPLLFLLTVAMALTMRAGAILRMPAGVLMVAFTAWVGVCVPFSVWMGGSMGLFQRNVQALVSIALIAAFVETVPQAIRALYTVGFASAFNAWMSFIAGRDEQGRLVLGENTLSDPNYYCLFVLFGIPFLFLAIYIGRPSKRFGALMLLPPMFLVIAKTGSRGGLVALAAGLIFLFVYSPARQKIYLTAAAAVLLVTSLAALPESLIIRFTTILDSDGDAMAAESSASRKELFFRSLEMTAKNPIVGVGPGMFTIGDAAYSKDIGRKAVWHVTHNTYTELSSEVGIPGAILFILALYRSYRGLSQIRRTDRAPAIRSAALFAQMSLVIVSTAACFLSVGYGSIPYIIIAVSGTFITAVAKQQNMNKESAIPVQPGSHPRSAFSPARARVNNSSYRRTTSFVE
jgi:O-antigen ligase